MQANPTRRAMILTAITDYTQTHGYPPSCRDLSEMVGISISTLHGHLIRMRRDGVIEWDDGAKRTVRVIEGRKDHETNIQAQGQSR